VAVFDILREELKQFNPDIFMVPIDPDDLVFEKRVCLKCFYCSRYDTKWTCPPRIPELDYQKIVLEYGNAAVVICQLQLEGKPYEEVRTKSTNELHKALLYLEKVLWEMDNPFTLTFIGGSCKLCKNGCAPDKCRNPGAKRIPLEAAGINVICSLEKVGIDISFKTEKVMKRFGLILW